MTIMDGQELVPLRAGFDVVIRGYRRDQVKRFVDDTEGARLIALNMALNGTPRDEVDRYLSENFDLSNRAGLIEEVYSSVEG